MRKVLPEAKLVGVDISPPMVLRARRNLGQCRVDNRIDVRVVKHTDFNSFAELRQTFPSVDKVGNLTVFNFGGNKARLIAAIHYNTHRVYIRHALTHKEYDRGSWRK